MMHIVSYVVCSLLLQLEGAPLPVVEVTLDDTVIDTSCTVVIPEGLVIEDANGDGVLHIETDGVSITFADGSVLRGASPEIDLVKPSAAYRIGETQPTNWSARGAWSMVKITGDTITSTTPNRLDIIPPTSM